MHREPMAPPRLITDPAALEALAARLEQASRIAVDTEAASFHRYFDRVYLLQVSSEQETALIDPLALADLAPIGRLLADQRIEVVFHDADYDLRVLDRDYGFRARRIFDTRVAAQLLGEPAVSLAALLEQHLGVRLDKRWQRADWSARPLSPEMIAYAAADTGYLLPLRDELARRLEACGRWAWAAEEFSWLEQVRWTPPDPDAGYLRLKGWRGLPPQSQRVLRALYQWREQLARTLDRAPFRIMGNEALLAVARALPRTREELLAVGDVPKSLARRYETDLLAAVEAGLASSASPPGPPARNSVPRPPAAELARLERLKALRNQRAAELGLEPGVLCPNGVLKAIARLAPHRREDFAGVEGLRRWQIEALGAERILAASAGAGGQ